MCGLNYEKETGSPTVRKNRERPLEIAGTIAFRANKQEIASCRFCH
jgi:nitrate/TMAO reductase-like tetraheme cytochrome c subunit